MFSVDVVFFVVFIVVAVGGLASIFFNSTNVLAYIQVFITVVGLLGSLKELKPNILGRVTINVKALRVINTILLFVIITRRS